MMTDDDLKVLAAYERDMVEQTIPEIMRAVAERQLLAVDARQRWMPLPSEVLRQFLVN